MNRTVALVLGLAVMIALIVGLDVLFLQGHFWLRLVVNVAIVGVLAVVYFRFISRL